MHNNLITTAAALSDEQLLDRLPLLARDERRASAELVAHLAELDARPALYAREGYGSLFAYCTGALHLSEDAACSRIEAARTCRRFPGLLDRLACGALTLTSIRLLSRHLTPDNHVAVLARAAHRTRREIEDLVAELAPRPDAAPLIRKLPAQVPQRRAAAPAAGHRVSNGVLSAEGPPVVLTPPSPRPVIEPLAPERYRVQFTLGAEAHARLRKLQALLRREIPSGDPAQIVDRALILLLAQVEARKLGAARRPRPQAPVSRLTHEDAPEGPLPARGVPNAVKREVWMRDGGQCAFVSAGGRRCDERVFLEFHHQLPWALRGEGTTGNVALRCRRHNQYEAQLLFDTGDLMGAARESGLHLDHTRGSVGQAGAAGPVSAGLSF